MKSKKVILLLIILMLTFSGCQETPDEEAVVNKGDGELEEIIQSTPQPTDANQWIDVLRGSTWDETHSQQNFECNMNAQIIVPNTSIFPVYIVTKRTFNADFVDTIVRYFTKDATGVRATSDTKEELEQRLIQVKRGEYVLDDNGVGRWEPYAGQDQDIAELEEQIENAESEVFEPISRNPITLPIDNTYSMADGSRVYIDANENEIYFTTEKHGLHQPESWIIEGDARPGEPEGTTLENVKIKENEAREKVTALIVGLQLENMGIATTEKARILNDLTGETITEGWSVTLARTDGDSLPVGFGSIQLDGLLYFASEDYIERWQPETITIFVDEIGIRSFKWSDPLVVTDEFNANVPLLPFEEVKERILKSIEYGLSQRFEIGNFSVFQISNYLAALIGYPPIKAARISPVYFTELSLFLL